MPVCDAPELPADARPPPPRRAGGRALRGVDSALRIALCGALAIGVSKVVGAAPVAGAGAFALVLGGLSAYGHGVPRAPRAASVASLGFALFAGRALDLAFPVAGAIGLIAGLRLLLHFGDGGAWLLSVHRCERQRRRALLGAGLALGHGSIGSVAGDLYEEAGWTRRELEQLGAAPRPALHWLSLGRATARILVGLPGVGFVARRLIAHVAALRATALSKRPAQREEPPR